MQRWVVDGFEGGVRAIDTSRDACAQETRSSFTHLSVIAMLQFWMCSCSGQGRAGPGACPSAAACMQMLILSRASMSNLTCGERADNTVTQPSLCAGGKGGRGRTRPVPGSLTLSHGELQQKQNFGNPTPHHLKVLDPKPETVWEPQWDRPLLA